MLRYPSFAHHHVLVSPLQVADITAQSLQKHRVKRPKLLGSALQLGNAQQWFGCNATLGRYLIRKIVVKTRLRNST